MPTRQKIAKELNNIFQSEKRLLEDYQEQLQKWWQILVENDKSGVLMR